MVMAICGRGEVVRSKSRTPVGLAPQAAYQFPSTRMVLDMAGRELTKGEIKKVNKKLGLAQQWYVRVLVLLVDLRTRAQPKLGSVRGGCEMTRGCGGPSHEAI